LRGFNECTVLLRLGTAGLHVGRTDR
jgi:hypothetical protein